MILNHLDWLAGRMPSEVYRAEQAARLPLAIDSMPVRSSFGRTRRPTKFRSNAEVTA